MLFEAHHAAMFRFAYRMTGVLDAAEDIAQECFLRAALRPAFDPERGSMRQYLYGIVRNLARQQQQANGREVALEGGAEDEAPWTDPVDAAELAAAVQAAISTLPPLQREAIVLCEFEELSLADAAAIVEADVGTVKSRLHRAREGLRSRLAPYRKNARAPLSKGTNL